MARYKGAIGFVSNFELKIQGALDARAVVENKSDLIILDTWPHDGDILYLYNGLLVSVEKENAVYMLTDITKALETDYSGWLKISGSGGGTGSVDIVDNLTTDASNKALSARQGKVLNDKINSLSSIYNFKGKKDTIDDLPSEGNKSGDVWYVEGDSYVWNGSSWVEVELPIDLSSYYTKEEIDSKEEVINANISGNNTIATEAKALSVKNKEDLSNLSINVQTINTTLTEVKTQSDGYASRIEALEKGGLGADITGQVSENTTAINNLKITVGDKSSGLVKNVTTLMGDSTVSGSVDYKIAQAFKWNIVPDKVVENT